MRSDQVATIPVTVERIMRDPAFALGAADAMTPGLVWLLQGREVVALTETAAAIENPTGASTIYRRHPCR